MECDNNENVISASFYEYYEILSDYYVEYKTSLTCTTGLFKEFIILTGSAPLNSDTIALIIGFGILFTLT